MVCVFGVCVCGAHVFCSLSKHPSEKIKPPTLATQARLCPPLLCSGASGGVAHSLTQQLLARALTAQESNRLPGSVVCLSVCLSKNDLCLSKNDLCDE